MDITIEVIVNDLDGSTEEVIDIDNISIASKSRVSVTEWSIRWIGYILA